jgi:hypothetical protein
MQQWCMMVLKRIPPRHEARRRQLQYIGKLMRASDHEPFHTSVKEEPVDRFLEISDDGVVAGAGAHNQPSYPNQSHLPAALPTSDCLLPPSSHSILEEQKHRARGEI